MPTSLSLLAKWVISAAIVVLVLNTTGCGQKGDLIRPQASLVALPTMG